MRCDECRSPGGTVQVLLAAHEFTSSWTVETLSMQSII